jgi:hypothetical protein
MTLKQIIEDRLATININIRRDCQNHYKVPPRLVLDASSVPKMYRIRKEDNPFGTVYGPTNLANIERWLCAFVEGMRYWQDITKFPSL